METMFYILRETICVIQLLWDLLAIRHLNWWRQKVVKAWIFVSTSFWELANISKIMKNKFVVQVNKTTAKSYFFNSCFCFNLAVNLSQFFLKKTTAVYMLFTLFFKLSSRYQLLNKSTLKPAMNFLSQTLFVMLIKCTFNCYYWNLFNYNLFTL